MLEMSLEDVSEEFKGGSLRINNKGDNRSVPDSPQKVENEKSCGNDSCQWRSFIMPNSISSMIPTKITEAIWTPEAKSSQSPENVQEKSLQPALNINEDASNYFTFRDGVTEKAVQECVEQFLDVEKEGQLQAAFLLTQINYWGTDKERLILLTLKSLVVVKYDFIALRRLSYKKIPIEDIEAIIVGNLIYPTGSLIPDRNMKGIRIVFKTEKPTNFATKWNPFNEDVPFWTFTFHPLFYHKDCSENLRKVYDLDKFIEDLSTIVELVQSDGKSKILFRDIILENYIGIGSVIHNRHDLGFFKVRGKFSF